MSGKYLLDTNIVIALFTGDLPVKKHIAKAEEVFIPATVIGELYADLTPAKTPLCGLKTLN